ncbi:SDR family NAD(P)-dependent oxidoreductase [Aurantimonas sp. VKM B-3413]|uniref:SDR family NAD(P)-dependent oxidoreductase n=1 Tax=Aurantimonas sp. VKM B-3413 TaxID=2779401 RepID=UPI001E2C5495|nr:SDR family oxidoreductase [Aurantimonas sp. VKM B-3413]MCB8840219.1 SDR family oxidoreductase [Aurantimonas sp. VKM B-3413]
MTTFEGRVALVTGGSSGIGLATAIGLARQGAKVLVTGRRQEALDKAVNTHVNVAGLIADVADPGDARRTIDEAVGRWGRLDLLVNNAGAGAIMPLGEADAEAIAGIVAVNVVGPSILAREALPHLAATKGCIVNVSSTFGHKAGAGLSHYAASKAALEHLARCWALELAAQGIRVNAVAAGPTESGALTGMMGLSAEQAAALEAAEREQIPLGRRGRPEDVARWILNLADPACDWVTGQVISIDGGLGLT